MWSLQGLGLPLGTNGPSSKGDEWEWMPLEDSYNSWSRALGIAIRNWKVSKLGKTRQTGDLMPILWRISGNTNYHHNM